MKRVYATLPETLARQIQAAANGVFEIENVEEPLKLSALLAKASEEFSSTVVLTSFRGWVDNERDYPFKTIVETASQLGYKRVIIIPVSDPTEADLVQAFRCKGTEVICLPGDQIEEAVLCVEEVL